MRDPTADIADGEFVTGDEMDVLRALWRDKVSTPGDALLLAARADVPVTMIERVETMLFPNGMGA